MTSKPEIASRASDEAEIRRRLDKFLESVRAMDLEGVRPIYARDIVSFDFVPPPKHVGAEAKLGNWVDVFAAYEPPLGYAIRELTLTVRDDVAFGRSFNRT